METYKISVATTRLAKEWDQAEVPWKKLVETLSATKRTSETFEEYMAMSKDKQGDVKDRGGFVGGALTDRLRKRGHVSARSLITFDLDECPDDMIDLLDLLNPYKMIIYSTHKHTSAKPRLRLIIPLTAECSEEEYEPLSRMVAKELSEACGFSFDCFDPTTHQATRLMYFPTTSKDGEFYSNVLPGKEVDPKEELAKYKDWHNTEEWPKSEKEETIRRSEITKLGDPTKKDFIIGYFCSVFNIYDVIERFLSDVYTEGTIKDRYTYVGSESSNGAIVYDNGTYLYSNHSHDPAMGQGALNAFDLVRIHKFGALDKDAPEGTKSGNLPSYKACKKWAESLPELKEVIDEARNRKASERARKDFEWDLDLPQEESDESWMNELQRHPENHKILETYNNYSLILNNDPRLKGLVGINQFSTYPEVLKKAPWKRADVSNPSWTDNDDAQLFGYINKYYGLKNTLFLGKAVEGWMSTNAFDPVKDFIESVKWDNKPRLERYFIDYLGADDNEYVRTVTKKMFVAAIARVYEPGCKFDYLVTLVGKQGLGKSLACRNLAGPNGRWFSDSISGAANLNAKETYESLRGQWIVEWGELAALKKGEREQVKLFLSKQTDTYRGAYLRRTMAYPRRCIFIGTTNDDTFLNDATGARRFLIIDCRGQAKKNAWDVTLDEVKQMWAEAKTYYDQGENIMDLADVARMVLEQQVAHTETNEYVAELEQFLEIRIPKDWYKKPLSERRQFIQATSEFRTQLLKESGGEEELVLREKACAEEFKYEFYGKDRSAIKDSLASRKINEAFALLGWIADTTPANYGLYGKQRGWRRSKTTKN